jgi:3-oxoacyl-(acyl-carrier-protein) synthase
MSKFMQYAMAASKEALEDAGWSPHTEQEKEMSVSPIATVDGLSVC